MAPMPPSRLASGLYPPSSTSAATAQYSNARSMIFASEWHFKSEGVELVKERFEAQLRLRKIDAIHGYNNHDQTFRIRCYPYDAHRVWPLFYTIVAKIIKDEAGEDEDGDDAAEWNADDTERLPLQSNLIEPLEAYRRSIGKEETMSPEIANEAVPEPEDEPSETIPNEVSRFKSTSIWPHNMDVNVKATLNLEIIAPDTYIEEIETSTGCRLIKVLNESNIHVGGPSKEVCDLVLVKLDNLCKYRLMKPSNVHVFYSEGEENFQLVLKPILDIRKFFFETTLLDSLQLSHKCNYQNLVGANTTRIAYYSHDRCSYASIKNLNISPAIVPEDKDRGLPEWANFILNRFGKPNKYHESFGMATQTNLVETLKATPGPLTSHPVPSTVRPKKDVTKDLAIQRWAEDVPEVVMPPSVQQELGMVMSGTANNNKTKPGWDIYKEFDSTPNLDSEYKPKQLSMGLATGIAKREINVSLRGRSTSPPSQQSSGQQSILKTRSQSSASGETVVPAHQARQSHSTASTAQPGPTQSPVRSSSSSASTRTMTASQFFQGLATSENKRADKPPEEVTKDDDALERYLRHPQERSLLDDDISVMDFSEPIMNVMKPIKLENDMPESLNSNGIVESMQLLSEIQTRIFHNTMDQRAPKPKHNPFPGRLPKPSPARATSPEMTCDSVIDPLLGFAQALDASFQSLLQPAQGFRGRVQVQADFGRVLLSQIHRKHITTKGSTDTLKSPESLEKLLDSGDFTSFTNVLSTTAGEMPYIRDLTDTSGKALWDTKAIPAWTVEYDFTFIDRLASHGPAPFDVVVNGETLSTRVERSRPLDNIYVHGIARHWDFKISAIGFESIRGLDDGYGALLAAIKSSLYIPDKTKIPILFINLDETMVNRYEIAGVRMRRTCEYKSKDAKSLLKISELYSLDIDVLRLKEESTNYFKFSPGPANRKPSEKPGLVHWYEVSVSSAELESILEENQKLELGDEAKWTPNEISELSIAKSIYLPALEMLKKMDGIGQYNHNGLDVRSGLNTTVSQSQIQVLKKDQFW